MWLLTNPQRTTSRDVADEIGSRLIDLGCSFIVSRGHRKRLTRVSIPIAIQIDVNGPVGQQWLVNRMEPVSVQVVPFHARDGTGNQMPVSKIGCEGAVEGNIHIPIPQGRLPTQLRHFAQILEARRNIGQCVGTIRIGHSQGFASIQCPIRIRIQIDRPAGEQRFIGRSRQGEIIERLVREAVQRDVAMRESARGQRGRWSRRPIHKDRVRIDAHHDAQMSVALAGDEQTGHFVQFRAAASVLDDVPIQASPGSQVSPGDEQNSIVGIRRSQPNAAILKVVYVHFHREIDQVERQGTVSRWRVRRSLAEIGPSTRCPVADFVAPLPRRGAAEVVAETCSGKVADAVAVHIFPLHSGHVAKRSVVGKVLSRVCRADRVHVRVDIPDRRGPTRLCQFQQIDGADEIARQGQRVVSIGVCFVRRLTGIELTIEIEVRVDCPASETFIPCVANGIAVVVIPFCSGDGGLCIREEIAKVDVFNVLAIEDKQRMQTAKFKERVRGGRRPASLGDFTNRLNPVLHAIDRVRPEFVHLQGFRIVFRSDGKGLAESELAVVVLIDIDRPASEQRFVRITNAVGVEVAPLHTADRTIDREKISEVHIFLILTIEQEHRVFTKRRNPANLRDFSYEVLAVRHARDRVTPIFISGRIQLAGIQNTVFIGVDVDRPTRQQRLAPVTVGVAVQVMPLHTADRTRNRLQIRKVHRYLIAVVD